ncbi:MAG TPA: 50S ribosomal protein L21 [Bryobacteraceae bacterium]|nr:50S ribosomal protein L21 [Bryobacteraceae bacterium]
MYAVIETGGKQYRVAPGETIEVETLAGEAGAQIEVGRVLALVDGDSVKAGSAAQGARVIGTILAHGRGPKTIVFKFKRKKQYKRTLGHRQNLTRVQIKEITA